MRAAFATLLACLLCLTAAPATAATTTCANTLTCTAEDINGMTIAQRLAFVRALSAGPAADIVPGYAPRWRNIEGVLRFFADRELGEPGTWVSYVDAGILEGIERGIALARGDSTDTFGNPGASLWASYLTRLRDGRLSLRSVHDRAWSEAEQASTEYGVALAERVHGVAATPVEERFYQFSEFYRWTLRNRPMLLDLLTPPVGPGDQRQLTFLDWFTDVTNDVPAHRGSHLAYDLAEFDVPGGTLNFLALFAAYADALAEDYLPA
ncbi:MULTISPECIES: hypothetical protein [Amycolatopsis]|uniref:Secreted protein n=1 Tax=Amycolatopsis thermalba TaxID=944492 RepID=A0ABY4NSP6_9PSEU|nr:MULTISPECIES: hypothetical protein [Amycolatopsis]OXM61473.1 hypothetical protein CF166_33875 [Amycolatopsis sp. KNN50.9b]UQS23072.1 hypothetical protein L1857_09710 [Amycolatopsis thermalba]